MSKIIKTAVALSVAGLAAMLAAPAAIAEKGDWIIRGGATMVDPKSNNFSTPADFFIPGQPQAIPGTLDLDVDDGTSFGFNITYRLTDNWGIELLAAYPFSHDLKGCANLTVGGTPVTSCIDAGEVEHLPPTLSLQYRFMPDSAFQPYVGLGINWTMFSSEKLTPEAAELLGIDDIKLDDSVGVAVQIGADWFFNDRWLINGDIRYIEIQSDLDVCADGSCVGIGKVKIDPMVYSIMIGYKF